MNQKDIFQNMTKGVWLINKFKTKIFEKNSLGVFMIAAVSEQFMDRAGRTANTEAIVSAVNNTYGERINPEGAKELKIALELILETHSTYLINPTDFTKMQFDLSIDNGYKALAAAKL